MFSPELYSNTHISIRFVDCPRVQELLLSYNVGIPVEQREKRMNERAAALVGLAMPRKEEVVSNE